MKSPLQITFREITRSDALETRIRSDAAKLEQLFPRIGSCRVTVVKSHRHHRQGPQFEAHVEVRAPGIEDVVSTQTHEDAYLAVRDAFEAARRQLEASEGRRATPAPDPPVS